MALHGMRGPNRRKYIATTNPDHGSPIVSTPLARNSPRHTGDIIYVATAKGWLAPDGLRRGNVLFHDTLNADQMRSSMN
ncbi:hypothetical protein SB861_35555 [Paraburkholderia sp. SIMBA_049]